MRDLGRTGKANAVLERRKGRVDDLRPMKAPGSGHAETLFRRQNLLKVRRVSTRKGGNTRRRERVRIRITIVKGAGHEHMSREVLRDHEKRNARNQIARCLGQS